MAFNKGVIEINIMGNKNFIMEDSINFFSHIFKRWSVGYHFIGNARHGLNEIGNWLPGID